MHANEVAFLDALQHSKPESVEVAFQDIEHYRVLSAFAMALPGRKCFVTEKEYKGEGQRELCWDIRHIFFKKEGAHLCRVVVLI